MKNLVSKTAISFCGFFLFGIFLEILGLRNWSAVFYLTCGALITNFIN